jgi:hypothetical protein
VRIWYLQYFLKSQKSEIVLQSVGKSANFLYETNGTQSVYDTVADGIWRAEWEEFVGGENLMRTISRIAIALLLGGAGAGIMTAQTMTLTGLYNGNFLDGIYDSPYTATIDIGGVSVDADVICDDFADEVSVGESWGVDAPAGSISSTSGTTGLWGSESSVGYQEIAWLSEQLDGTLSNPQSAAQIALQGEISYAIWAVFDPTGVSSWLNSYGDTTTSKAVFGTNGWLAQAALNYGSAPQDTVYTPSGYTGTGKAGEPQEFIVVGTATTGILQSPPVSTAEAPAAATLGIDLLGLGALFFVFRHQRLAVR